MVVGCHQQPTIVASFFDNVKGLQMLHQQPSLTLTWQSSSLTMPAIFFDNGSHIIGNIPTITLFAIYVGNCPLASSTHACILQLFQAYHSKSIFDQVYRYLPNLSITKAHLFSHKRITTIKWSATSHLKSVNACLWDNIPLRAYQPCLIRNDLSSLTSRLTTPPQMEISISKCNNHYLSISMWSRAHHSSKSLLIPELRLPSVPL